MGDVYIIGASMTPFGRFLDTSVKHLTHRAVHEAMTDAKLTQEIVGAAYFSNTTQGVIEGQYLVAGEIALREMGFEGIPMVNVENACASASSAFHGAYLSIKAEMTDVALAIGADKMYDRDKDLSFAIFDGAWDVHNVAGTIAGLDAMGEGVKPPPGTHIPNGKRSPFMDVYANFAKYHMKTFGSSQAQLAAVAAKNHHHSTMNPLSQYRDDYSVDDIMSARIVSWPLTLPMCSPISDGAAAAILCSEDYLSQLDENVRARAIKIGACELGTGTNRKIDEFHKHLTHLAAKRAYDRAGIAPEDISVAEVHDATAFGEITQTENLGFCEFGEGGRLAEQGETSIGGRIPINPSGGLESKGHPIGATGLSQIYELVTQLRGEAGARQVEDARYAIAENGGGIYGIEESVCCITILARS
jgi:acetyl-CoA acetyltransferase